MGQTLSQPVIGKKSSQGEDECCIYGVSAMQGWRTTMEDAHAAVLDLQAKFGKDSPKPTEPDKRLAFFGVYDGHGGDKVALFAGRDVHSIVAKQESFARGDVEQALKDGFLATDRAILEDPSYEMEVSGCTAAVSVVSRETIWVANAGDSRAVLGSKGRAKPLSFDHKPQNEGEKARISAAGGFVDFGRVNGNLALSRAIGDFEFKRSPKLSPEQQIVTAYPDVTVHQVTDEDEFLVIACDGIWDCQSSQSTIEFVRRGIAARQDLQQICENMMDNCLSTNCETGGVGCDNMTMVIVGLLHGKTKEEWYNQIADRVAKGDGPCAPPEYAELRGPGIRQHFRLSPEDYEYDVDRTRGFSVRSGRIILLGDGTEITTEQQSEDELFDQSPDRVSVDHVPQDQPETTRNEREGTPAPQLTSDTPSQTSETPSGETSESNIPPSAAINGTTETPAEAHQEKHTSS